MCTLLAWGLLFLLVYILAVSGISSTTDGNRHNNKWLFIFWNDILVSEGLIIYGNILDLGPVHILMNITCLDIMLNLQQKWWIDFTERLESVIYGVWSLRVFTDTCKLTLDVVAIKWRTCTGEPAHRERIIFSWERDFCCYNLIRKPCPKEA